MIAVGAAAVAAVEEGVNDDGFVAVLLALHLGRRGGRGHDLKIQRMFDKRHNLILVGISS